MPRTKSVRNKYSFSTPAKSSASHCQLVKKLAIPKSPLLVCEFSVPLNGVDPLDDQLGPNKDPMEVPTPTYVWVYSKQDQVYVPCITQSQSKKFSANTTFRFLLIFINEPIEVDFSLPNPILQFYPQNKKKHKCLCDQLYHAERFKNSKSFFRKLNIISNQVAKEKEKPDIRPFLLLLRKSSNEAPSKELVNDFSSELSDLSSSDEKALESFNLPIIKLKHPEPLDHIVPISLSQEILTSDEEAFISSADSLRIGQALFAYWEKPNVYAPAKLLSMKNAIYHVRFFDGRKRKLTRQEIQLPGDPQFLRMDCVTLPTLNVNPNYTNEYLETCLTSIYPILDNILNGLHPSWRYQTYLKSSENRLTWNLGGHRGGNPYSENEYALIQKLLGQRYSMDFIKQLEPKILQSGMTLLERTKNFTSEMKAIVLLLDLVIFPECMLRLLLVSHLLLRSNDKSHNNGFKVKDIHDWYQNYVYGSEIWSKKKSRKHFSHYPLSIEQETKEVMEKAENLLKDSNWVHALISLKESSHL